MPTVPNNDGSELSLTTLIEAQHLVSTAPHKERKGYGPWVGPFRGIRRGQGLDFDDLRPYAEGDDVRHIDWKVTARYNAPYTRLYREEKDDVMTLAVNFCRSMFTGSDELRAVQAGKVTAALLWKSINAGSRCSVQVIDDTGVHGIPARAGERGALAGCQLIAERFKHAKLQAMHQGHTPTNAPLETLTNRIARNRRLFGNIIIVSGFDQTGDELNQQLHALSSSTQLGQHLCAIHIVDRIEIEGIPSGRYSYNSGKSKIRIRLNHQQSKKLTRDLQHQRLTVKQSIQNANITFISSDSDVTHCVNNVLRLGWVA